MKKILITGANSYIGTSFEKYIKDNYTLGENWSWDYIIDAEYIPNDFDDPIEIDFYNLKP